MHASPYLEFNGNCREAIDCYAKATGGTVVSMRTFGETPAAEHVPAEGRSRIMHAALQLGDGHFLMASDGMPGQPWQGIKGVSVALHPGTPAEAERLRGQLAEGGQVTLPIDRTFRAERFGMLVDPFGVPWIINGLGDVGDCEQ